MNYNNYPYSIFNQSSLLNYGQQNISSLQQHQAEQQKNILEMRKAIRDYCEAARKASPEYQQMAIDACLREIVIQVAKNDTN